MSENIAAIRRESAKHECIADQTDGDARRLNLAKAITYETIAGILEDPKKRSELFRIATGKPNLRLVSPGFCEDASQIFPVSDRVLVLLESLSRDPHDQ